MPRPPGLATIGPRVPRAGSLPWGDRRPASHPLAVLGRSRLPFLLLTLRASPPWGL